MFKGENYKRKTKSKYTQRRFVWVYKRGRRLQRETGTKRTSVVLIIQTTDIRLKIRYKK